MLTNPQHAVQFDFLRALGGRLRKSISKLVMLREFGTQPLAYQWFKSAVCFWNKVVDRQNCDPSDWLVLAMRENAQLSVSTGIAAHVRSSLWAGQFQKLLHSLPDASSFLPGGAGSTFDISVTPWPSIHVDQASKAFHRLVFSPLLSPSDDPRMASSTEVTYSTYENWFASAPFYELPAEHAALWTSSFHLLGGLKRSHLLALLRFRLGAHDLRVVSGKWERHNGLPRSLRLCERCSQHCVEDEYHMVFDCDAYESIRDRHRPLFDQGGTGDPGLVGGFSHVGRRMAEFMNQTDVRRLSSFIYECFLTRALGVDPALNLLSESGGSVSSCFLSCESAGSWPASDVDDDFISCSTDDSGF
jgi:hypothetical protein